MASQTPTAAPHLTEVLAAGTWLTTLPAFSLDSRLPSSMRLRPISASVCPALARSCPWRLGTMTGFRTATHTSTGLSGLTTVLAAGI